MGSGGEESVMAVRVSRANGSMREAAYLLTWDICASVREM